MKYRTKEIIELGVIFALLLAASIIFGSAFIGVVAGYLDPKCVHLLSPPPDHFWTEGKRVTCD